MTVPSLLKYGVDAITRMAVGGELAPQHVWVALKGATKYALAIASRDTATADTGEWRAETCARCPLHTTRDTAAVSRKRPVVAIHCGDPFVEGAETCGCLVAITVGGTVYAAGKTKVGSERCPSDRW